MPQKETLSGILILVEKSGLIHERVNQAQSSTRGFMLLPLSGSINLLFLALISEKINFPKKNKATESRESSSVVHVLCIAFQWSIRGKKRCSSVQISKEKLKYSKGML